MLKKFVSYVLAVVFGMVLAVSPLGVPAQAASSGVDMSLPDSMYSNTSANYSIGFTATSVIPAGGKIVVTYPAGFGLGAVSAATTPAVSGTTWNAVGSVLTITLGASSIPSGAVTVNLSGVDNASQGNYSLTVATKNASDATLDGPFSYSFYIRGAVSNYSITEPSSVIVNQPFTLAVTALDSNGYTTMGSSNVTLSAQTKDGVTGSGTLSVSSVDTNNANGYTIISQTYSRPESIKVRATDGAVGDVGWNNISPATNVTFTMTKLALSPTSATIKVGAKQQFTATASDNLGNNFNVTSSSVWSTTDPRASLTQSGSYTAGQAGDWVVKATYGGFSATANVHVTTDVVATPTNPPYVPNEQATATPTTTSTKTAATVDQNEKDKQAAELEALRKQVASGASTSTTKKDNTVEKVVFTVVALGLLGLAAYFLFRKSPEEKQTIEIQKPEDIIRQITEKEAEIKKQHEENLKKEGRE